MVLSSLPRLPRELMLTPRVVHLQPPLMMTTMMSISLAPKTRRMMKRRRGSQRREQGRGDCHSHKHQLLQHRFHLLRPARLHWPGLDRGCWRCCQQCTRTQCEGQKSARMHQGESRRWLARVREAGRWAQEEPQGRG